MYNMVKQFELSKLILEDNINKLTKEIKDAETSAKAYEAYSDKILEVEKYSALIDPKLQASWLCLSFGKSSNRFFVNNHGIGIFRSRNRPRCS